MALGSDFAYAWHIWLPEKGCQCECNSTDLPWLSTASIKCKADCKFRGSGRGIAEDSGLLGYDLCHWMS